MFTRIPIMSPPTSALAHFRCLRSSRGLTEYASGQTQRRESSQALLDSASAVVAVGRKMGYYGVANHYYLDGTHSRATV